MLSVKRPRRVALLLCLGCLLLAAAAPAMDIVRDGRPCAAIVVAQDAPRMVLYAAQELQHYIARVSGARLEITATSPAGNVIYVGPSQYTEALGLSVAGLRPDGYRMVCRGRYVALLGRESEPTYGFQHPLVKAWSYNEELGVSSFGETGTLYAVYRFLEDVCGVRWFMPGELGEVVPHRDSIRAHRTTLTVEPDFEYRTVFYNNLSSDREGAQWYRRAGFGAPAPANINHSFNTFKKYKDTHPEYFALVGSRRDVDITCQGGGNLCLSEPGVLTQMVADALQYFAENPTQNLYSVMPMDGQTQICECERCQQQQDAARQAVGTVEEIWSGKPGTRDDGRYTDYIWGFVNRVAIEVAKTRPDRLIGCCAYGLQTLPPNQPERLNPNVAVMICRDRVWNFDPQCLAFRKKMVEDWSRKTDVLYTWEYYRQVVGAWKAFRGLPVFFPRITAVDLQFLKGRVKGEFNESESWNSSAEPAQMRYPALTAPTFYVTGRLYWDVTLDVDYLLDDFYTKFYGPAALEMKRFWTEAERLWTLNSPGRPYYVNQPPESDTALFRTVYTHAAMQKLVALLGTAVGRTQVGSSERQRIEMLLAEMQPAIEKAERVAAQPQ
jgi:hypothetical protein